KPPTRDMRAVGDVRSRESRSQIYQLENRPAVTSGSLLLDSWRTIRRHWRLVAAIVLVGCFVTLLITIFQTPAYRAFALLEVRSLNGEFMDLKTVDPTSSGTPDAAEADVQTQIKVIE